MEGVTSALIYDRLNAEKLLIKKETLLETIQGKKDIEVIVTIGAGDIDKYVARDKRNTVKIITMQKFWKIMKKVLLVATVLSAAALFIVVLTSAIKKKNQLVCRNIQVKIDYDSGLAFLTEDRN